MSQSGVVAWSQTASSNATADANVNWAEGQAPSSVNDSARATMASVAKFRDDTSGALATGGTSTAYTLTTNQSFSSLSILDGQTLSVRFTLANGAAPTLNVDGLGAKPINVSISTAVAAGVIKTNSVWDVTYRAGSANVFLLHNVPGTAQDDTVDTAGIVDSAVTYAKIQDVADQRLLGNFSGAADAPSEIAVSGPSYSSGTLTFPFPPAGAFVGLSLTVASNTTVTCAATYVTMTDGSGAFFTGALSATLNLSTSGAANGLDAGSIAANTFYFVYAIYNPTTGLVKVLASTSATSPTMPSNFTYKARIGAVKTASGAAQLMGTIQKGKRVQYVVGVAQTTLASLVVANGTAGTYSGSSPTLASQSVASFVPSTASVINFMVSNDYGNAASFSHVLVAPSTSWGGTNNGPTGSNNVVWPLWYSDTATMTTASNLLSFMLESTSIGWCSSGDGGAIACLGWEDNL